MRIAIATSRDYRGFDPDEPLLVRALASRGVTAELVCWDDASFDFSRVRGCVIRSTWDYTERRDAFVAWAERTSEKTLLMNDAETVRWNTHKGYLRELEANGVAIVPTAWVSRALDARELGALLEARGWSEAVVKPAVSANARDTARVRRTNESLDAAATLVAKIAESGDVMIQPYLASVEARGERSLVFFDGELSHAIKKNPALVASRAPHGEERRADVSDDEVRFARAVLGAAMQTVKRPLYARVDIANDDRDALALMELELVEPSLFLPTDEGAAARLADAIARRLSLL
jgi:hypothetical protein